ncbi:uncharacterized protein LOC125943743 [Dermacentor silvarum]|uniref:uncharacterized protein LOC125943743 n=1 Tax=Dermacentor silvarum TaxID=543639 RepID=UPI0021015631|nr:uncharacterized protein LOC125943743 [Dermacentor silvarum]
MAAEEPRSSAGSSSASTSLELRSSVMTEAPAFKFTEEQTRRLIIRRHELQHLFTGKRNAAKQGWLRIIEDAGLQGATPEQCRKKWLNLLKKYKDLKNPPSGAGNEEGELLWPFFDLMDCLMSGRAIITPPRLIASTSGDQGEEHGEDTDEQPTVKKRRCEDTTQKKKKENVMDRILSNVEKQTELMGRMFDFFMNRGGQQ